MKLNSGTIEGTASSCTFMAKETGYSHLNNHKSDTKDIKDTHGCFGKLQSMFLFVAVVGAMVVALDSYKSREHEDSKLVRQLQSTVENPGTTLLVQVNSTETTAPFLQATHGLQLPGYPTTEIQIQYEKDLAMVDWTAVSNDLAALLRDSKDWWPADYGTYGPLMMRLSWHACGSFRGSDGRGGCDGGGIRYDPERSWPDNTNLDKARRLLKPIKLKYGNGVSWGDLFALVGTVAIREMGGPSIGFCAGRQDVQDNSQTLPLGPSIEQEKFAPCPTNGQCPFPLGSNTLGLVSTCAVRSSRLLDFQSPEL
jgi:Peroxidase